MTSRKILKRGMGLSWLQLMHSFRETGDAQCCIGEHVIEPDNGNRTVIVLELYCAFDISCITLLNQKSHGNINSSDK